MSRSVLSTILFAAFAIPAAAGNFGTLDAKPAATPAVAPAPATVGIGALATGPQVGENFLIVKPDGATVIQAGKLSATAIATITVSDKDAFLTSGGKCAFNVKYDEVSPVAAAGTTNRLYDNDALIAQNTKIDLAPGVPKTIWTQPYLVPGTNNIRVVVNADGALPSTKWIRVNVTGTCGAAAAVPASAPTTPADSAATARTETHKPAATPAPAPAPAPVVNYAPGSGEWNNLNLIWGYSNYATTQLKNAGYARYAELAKLNAAVTAVINARTVDQTTYNSLVASWNTFVTEEKFKALMAAVVPASGK